jgi:hypothetical protein
VTHQAGDGRWARKAHVSGMPPSVDHASAGRSEINDRLFTTSDISSDRMALALSGSPLTAMTFGTACSFQRGADPSIIKIL